MTPFIYECTSTGLRVQGLVRDDPKKSTGTGNAYESITCLACGGVHLVNPKTGKTAGMRSQS
jgi:hypothetical protein